MFKAVAVFDRVHKKIHQFPSLFLIVPVNSHGRFQTLFMNFLPLFAAKLRMTVVPLLLAEFDASAAVRPTSRLAPESTAPLTTGQDFQFVVSNFCLDVDGERTG